jgi:anti-sigma regulatory factor (Ser/Thr protein kinase)
MPSVRTAELALPPEARSAGIARRFLSATLASWDADGYSDTGSLLLSELVTNAALHAGTEILVRVCLTSTGLRLEVADRSDRRPVIRHYSAQATTGRGLGMVDSLAERWGVVPEATGKTVWAELTWRSWSTWRRSLISRTSPAMRRRSVARRSGAVGTPLGPKTKLVGRRSRRTTW